MLNVLLRFLTSQLNTDEVDSREASKVNPDQTITMRNDTPPIDYHQVSYDIGNGCVWLSACLLIKLVDIELTDHLSNCYNDNIYTHIP